MPRPPEYISSLLPYVPGKPVEELERELGIKGAVKLASNENPLGPSPKAVEALKAAIGGINRYPDGGGYYLREALAGRLSVDMEELILGNGSNELIDIAVRTYLRPGDEAVMAKPSFVVYATSVKAQGAKAVETPLKNWRHDLDAMAKAITPKTRMLFIANPNNPTGAVNTKEELNRLFESLPIGPEGPEGLLVVVDEAYYEYVRNPDYADSILHFRAGRDILVLRTFSKIYGLAGLRIGYGIAKKDIIEEMNKLRPPFNANSLAQAGAVGALKDEEHLRRTVQANEEGKRYLYGELDSLGVRYVPTEANFIYILLGRDSKAVYGALLREGVITRPMGPEEIRVTIGTMEENRRFVKAFGGIYGHHSS